MPINGHTIVFDYNPSDLKYFFPLGLMFLFVPFVIFVCMMFMEVPWHIHILGLPFLITAIILFVTGWIIRRNKEKEIYISVSPKGVITPKGKFIQREEIDYCFIKFEVSKETNLIYKAKFVVVLKSGKKKSFNFINYIVPFDWNMEIFPKRVNEIVGIPLFRDSVISIHETRRTD